MKTTPIPTRRLLVRGQTAVYHVISRTTCKQFLFGPKEKEVFRKMLWKQAAFHGVEVLTYCILSNHFHLLVRIPHADEISDDLLTERYRSRYAGPNRPFSAPAPEVIEATLANGGDEAKDLRGRLQSRMGDLPVFMRELKQCFSIWYNDHHKNFGTIWASRFKSLIVEDAPESLKTVAAYIDLNPVRAGIVNDPAEYRWCGYAEALGGSLRMRKGLCTCFHSANQSWSHALPAYRLLLYGKGRRVKGLPGKDQGRIPDKTADAVHCADGKPGLSETLRHRIRYFSDGMVLGSKDYLHTYFEENRENFGPKRKSGPRSMRGGDWGSLHIMRSLKDAIE